MCSARADFLKRRWAISKGSWRCSNLISKTCLPIPKASCWRPLPKDGRASANCRNRSSISRGWWLNCPTRRIRQWPRRGSRTLPQVPASPALAVTPSEASSPTILHGEGGRLDRKLALGELERAPCFGPAVLLTFDHARVAGEEAAALQCAAQIGLVVHQRLGQAVAHGASLAGQAAARNGAGDVVLAAAVGRHQRLLDQHAQHRPRKINLDLAGIDNNLAGAGLDPNPRHRILALAGGIGPSLLVELLDVFRSFGRGSRLERRQLIERLHGFGHGHALLVFLRFKAATSSVSGFCAACGCAGPA